MGLNERLTRLEKSPLFAAPAGVVSDPEAALWKLYLRKDPRARERWAAVRFISTVLAKRRGRPLTAAELFEDAECEGLIIELWQGFKHLQRRCLGRANNWPALPPASPEHAWGDRAPGFPSPALACFQVGHGWTGPTFVQLLAVWARRQGLPIASTAECAAVVALARGTAGPAARWSDQDLAWLAETLRSLTAA